MSTHSLRHPSPVRPAAWARSFTHGITHGIVAALRPGLTRLAVGYALLATAMVTVLGLL